MAVAWVAAGFLLWTVADTSYAQEYERHTVSWDPVTHRENGEELGPDELLFYRVNVLPEGASPETAEQHEVSPDRTSHEIQALADTCYRVTAYSAATGSPSCKPEQQYLLSAPSDEVAFCGSEAKRMNPNPPREFM